MKSIFSKLSTLLLCGAVAMVGCTDYSDDIQDLEAKTTASIEQLKAEVQSTYATKEALAGVVADLEALEGDVAELEALVANKADKTELDAAKKDLQDKIDAAKKDLQDKIDAAKSDLEGKINAAVEAVNKELDGIKGRLATVEGDVATLKTDLTNLTTTVNNTVTKLDNYITEANGRLADLEANKADKTELEAAKQALQEQIDAMKKALDELTALVNKAYTRVQSLVYVPDYSDHKADIKYSRVYAGVLANNEPVTTIINTTSQLKYVVKSTTLGDAKNAAASIEAAWETVLKYLVKPVETRSEEVVEAKLEIVDVTAEEDVITVTVRADGFDSKFYNDPINDTAKEGIYSAALALNDDNGTNLTSEYTNLVPVCLDELSMVLYAGEGEDLAITTTSTVIGPDDLPVAFQVNGAKDYYIAANDSLTTKTILRPSFGFISNIAPTNPATIYSVENLAEMGYAAGEVTTKVYVDTVMVTEGPATVNDLIIFNPEGENWTAQLSSDVTWENVGDNSTLTYEYTWNGNTIYLGNVVEISNKKVSINLEETKTWTLAIQDALFDGTHFAKPYLIDSVKFTSVGESVALLKPVLNSPSKPRAATKFYVKNAADEWVEISESERPFKVSKFNNDGSVDLTMVGGKYSWNNSYKIVWETVNENKNVDYTTTAIVNLIGKPAQIDVPVAVTYAIDGTNEYFSADIDLTAEAYKLFKEYLGYADSATDSLKFKSYIADKIVAQLSDPNNTNVPEVNTAKGKVENLAGAKEARLFYDQVKESNETKWSYTWWGGIPFNFVVTGTVDLPEATLVYSQDYVKPDSTATVYGQIDGTYSIIKSDLGKYFNVDAESLEGHNYTVKFNVVSPATGIKVADKNGAPNLVTPVTDRNTGNPSPLPTYNGLVRDNVILDWADYRGLEVKVNATLYVNGYAIGKTLPLTLVTEDPLTLTGAAEFTVERELRKNLKVQVFQKLVLTSSIEPDDTKENLLVLKNADGSDKSLPYALSYAKKVYDVDLDVVLGTAGVYYLDQNQQPVVLATNKYDYDSDKGFLTIYGDDAEVTEYFADFTAIMTSKICGGEHEVPFTVKIVLKK